MVGVDVGGTFTDAVLSSGDTTEVTVKVHTTEPPTTGVLESVQRACDKCGIDPTDIDHFRHGSTVATNALLERRGATTALITTAGFRDVLEIGRQDRPSLYDLTASKPSPLIPRERRFGIPERTPPPNHADPKTIETQPREEDLDELRESLSEVDAIAVSLLHADTESSHEQYIVEYLTETLNVPVIASSDIDPTVREYERTATTAASAYLTPVIAEYLDGLLQATQSTGLPQPLVMQSNGGVATTDRITDRAVTSVLSGPAAGVVGASSAVEVSQTVDTDGCITLDMGGTSADVSLIEGDGPHRTTHTTVGDIPIRVPAIDIHTVGAGGGSIAWVDAGGALRVGPKSTGATPGPACYDRGGTDPTVTDAAVVLGIISPDRTLGRRIGIEPDRSWEVMADLADEAGLASPQKAAEGTYRVATETMTQAIRHITVERGHDPRSDTLIAFGGAGGMHAAAIADGLDIETVVIPPQGGLLSAAGLVAADERHDVARGSHLELKRSTEQELEDLFTELASEARTRCSKPDRATLHRRAELRYHGQSYELTVAVDKSLETDALRERFANRHHQLRGYTLDDRIDVIACRVEAVVPTETAPIQQVEEPRSNRASRPVTVPPTAEAEYTVFEGTPTASAFEGPSVIERPNSTVVIPPNWTLKRGSPLPILRREEPA